MSIILKNTGTTTARVFGPTGAIIVIEPGKGVEVSYTAAQLNVEVGASVSITDKKQQTNAPKENKESAAGDKKS